MEYTETEALQILELAIKNAGRQSKFCRAVGITQKHIIDVRKGRKQMGAKVLDALGLEIVYKVKPSPVPT